MLFYIWVWIKELEIDSVVSSGCFPLLVGMPKVI